MRFLSLFLLIIFCACAPVRTSQTTPSAYPSKKVRYYLVKRGDTLWEISKMTGVSVETIMKENRISSPNNLKVGEKLVLSYQPDSNKFYDFSWPIKGQIVNFFGDSVNNVTNRGIDIKSEFNREVKASASGQVVFASDLRGWGKTLILKHPQSVYTLYANLNNLLIKENSSVKKGQTIAKLSENSKGVYLLHFEIRKRYLPEDPLKYLSQSGL